MLSLQNQKITFNMARCTQCGVCFAACPHEALDGTLDETTGLTRIFPNEKCVLCGKCVAVCPARILPEKTITGPVTPITVLLGGNIDPKIRTDSSSGGAIRTLVQQALRSGLVENAYLLVRDEAYPWSKGALVGKDFEIGDAANSMYLPVLAGRNLNLAQGGKSILLVGTTCQLQGAFRLLKKRYDKIYSIAVFCKQQKTLHTSRHFARRLGTAFSLLGPPMQYRGEGWPGLVRLGERAEPYKKMAAFPYRQRLWRIPGCRSCPDPFCLDADISVADPWGIDQDSPTGRSMLAVWTAKGTALLESCGETLCSEKTTVEAMLPSVDFDGILCKSKLAAYYAGKKVSMRTRIAGTIERGQIGLLEILDKIFPIPEVCYRILTRIPLLACVLLKK